ncbi:MAG: hypothetical protein HQL21_08370, partial [Candidatus Omnitrophica bacterium]|nr:hypothetical protein [Candidatus Omnitrophota bacterium]
MYQFFQSELDYIFFVYGLSFICLAVTSFYLYFRKSAGSIWKWLGFFGLLHGIVEWMDMAEMSAGAYPFPVKMFKIGLNALSFLFLVELARDGFKEKGLKGVGRWIYIPLVLALVPAWMVANSGGINALSRYLFGCLGGLMAARVLFLSSKDKE